jgi:hypothetical protein
MVKVESAYDGIPSSGESTTSVDKPRIVRVTGDDDLVQAIDRIVTGQD